VVSDLLLIPTLRPEENKPPENSPRGGTSANSERTSDALHREWRFHSDLSSVISMRWELRGLLGATELSLNETEDLVLAVSDAANNAVEDALDPREPFFDVSADIDGATVTIVVQDHGQWRRPTSDTGRGRGLPIMRALADTTVTPRPHGTTVTIRNHRAGVEALTAEDGQASQERRRRAADERVRIGRARCDSRRRRLVR
jgi:anti-sigma regulatory factor (Ser/Thr protein kinase)